MEALWNLEDKWKLTTQEAVVLFVFSAFAVLGLCAATILKRKAGRKLSEEKREAMSCSDGSIRWCDQPEGGDSNDWITIRRVLMESMRWSGGNKWEESSTSTSGGGSGSGRETVAVAVAPVLVGSERMVVWESHNSVSPVWQRPILMGEKCELPRYSGLILYDERGRLLDHSHASSGQGNIKEKPAAAVVHYVRSTNTSKDLL